MFIINIEKKEKNIEQYRTQNVHVETTINYSCSTLQSISKLISTLQLNVRYVPVEALSAENRPKFCSPSPAMVTSPYK
jgi:hypothetical protein